MASRKRKAKKVSDQIRAAIESSGVSIYRIAAETGIDKSALSRFMSGERGLSTTALDSLGEFLGLEIVVRKRKP